MAEKKSTTGKGRSTRRKRNAKSKRLCIGKLSNGKPCSKTAENGKKFCRWHDPEDENWREVYIRLEKSTPEEKAEIVLRLIEDHPEHRLVLPERDGQKANLTKIDLSKATFLQRRDQARRKASTWWSVDRNLANFENANLEGATLYDANLQTVLLGGANLQRADLRFAKLQHAHLRNADLQYAWFRRANLYETNFESANLESAQFDRANLQEAHLEGAKLQGADLREAKLQGVNLSIVDNMFNVYINGALLDKTSIRCEKLGDGIGEERTREYAAAKSGYLALKQNFYDLGDYEAASWAYRKERRMEKLQAKEKARSAFAKYSKASSGETISKKREWGEAVASYFKYVSDTLVEWLCDYGWSVWRVIGWLTILLLVIGPVLLSSLGGVIWSKELAQEYFALSTSSRFWLWYRIYLLYTLDTMTTASFSGLQPANDAVKFASGFFAIAGIVLAGLLGFVAGNRIRRS